MPYWLWIGNQSQINSTPATNVTNAEMASVNGITASGPDEISAVWMSGEINKDNYQTSFNTNATPTAMNYTAPDGTNVSGVYITTFLTVTVSATTYDDNGNEYTVGSFAGVFTQLSNADMFIRPQSGHQDTWSSLDTLHSVTLSGAAKRADNNAVNPNVAFNSYIVDLRIIPCFTRGTLILTDRGELAVEHLKVGDLVMTLDRGFRAIRWIGSRVLDERTLHKMPHLRPIRIQAGALGAGSPTSDLLVSPQHRILARSKIAIRMFGTEEILVAAKHLLGLSGVEIAETEAPVEYFHFMFDDHEIVYSNGCATESLYPGPTALKATSPAARQEILALFPELRDLSYIPQPARQLASGRQGRKLTERHVKNAQALFS